MANISMTDVSLRCHPDSDAGSVESVEAAVTRGQKGQIDLVYRVSGVLGALKIADPATPIRADGLWKTTCFEVFIGCCAGNKYLEYNFSPSGQWAAYKFSDYRSNMVQLEASAPKIEVRRGDNILAVTVSLRLPGLYCDGPLRVGMSAILESKDGVISYWALAHPPGKPDFHHKDCFALQLEARSAA